MIVVSRNKGGAYIICDLNGTLSHTPIAAFRVVPYLVRRNIDISDLKQHIDVSIGQLRELERSTTADPDDPDNDCIEEIREVEEHSEDEDDGDDGTERLTALSWEEDSQDSARI